MSSHRSSSTYKVGNKPFKGAGNHRSKGAVKRQAAGRPGTREGAGGGPRQSVKHQGGSDAIKAASRQRKAQQLKQQRQQQRELRRQGAPPRLALLLPLSSACQPRAAASALAAHCGVQWRPDGSPLTLAPPNLARKQLFTLMVVDPRNVLQVLEACLVADVIIPLVDAVQGVAEEGIRIASIIKAQGLPAVLPLITGLGEVAEKNRHAAKKGLLSDLQYLFPNVARVLPLDYHSDADVGQVWRFVEAARLQELHFRQARSFLLAEQAAFSPGGTAAGGSGVVGGGANGPAGNDGMGVLRVTGYLRGGNGLSADTLVHISGLGDFQIERILDPDNDGVVLHSATEQRPSLQAENEPDPFAGGEQTWPTDADVEMAGMSDNEGENEQVPVRRHVVRRKVPAGMSDYQAAWLVDSEEDEEEDGVSSQEMDVASDHQAEEAELARRRRNIQEDPDGDAGLDLMSEDEMDPLEAKRNKEREEQFWPDEVEAPADLPARERYQKYRGLESFRTSTWDPKESLPVDYSRIFQLENFAHFVRRNLKVKCDTVLPGARVTLELKCPAELAARLAPNRPLVVTSLLKHEQKISVLHFDVMKHPEYHEPLESRDELVVAFGARRLKVSPVFSQHVGGSDRCKYERFLPSEGATMASFFGPITYTPCSISMFKLIEGQLVLVASGTLRSANADLLLLKKIILTAHPAKVHKRSAVCKGMFHFPEDVKWFKPVALWTKEGRLGHIRESNGTKGDFKAVFDGILNNSDTVCMSLYKRVFPKWSFSIYWAPPY